MDLSTVARACLRRFYVVVLIVGLAGFFAVRLYEDAAPQYSVSATVAVVQSPSLTLVRAGGPTANPYGAGTGATTLATVLSDSLNTRTVQSTFVPAGSSLLATWDSETSQLVSLTTVSNTVIGAQTAMDATLAQLDTVLRDIQVRAGAPVDQLYVSSIGAPADVPLETFPDRLRTVVAVVLAGLLVAVVLAVLLDGLLLRRRASRHAVPAAPAVEPAGGSGARSTGRSSTGSASGPPTGPGNRLATGSSSGPATGSGSSSATGPGSGPVRIATPGRPPTTGERAAVTPHSFPVAAESASNGRHG